MDDIWVYSEGIIYASVCAVSSLSGDEVAARVTATRPTGLAHGWRVSPEPTFRTGEPNGCQCPDHADRRHWLLSC